MNTIEELKLYLMRRTLELKRMMRVIEDDMDNFEIESSGSDNYYQRLKIEYHVLCNLIEKIEES